MKNPNRTFAFIVLCLLSLFLFIAIIVVSCVLKQYWYLLSLFAIPLMFLTYSLVMGHADTIAFALQPKNDQERKIDYTTKTSKITWEGWIALGCVFIVIAIIFFILTWTVHSDLSMISLFIWIPCFPIGGTLLYYGILNKKKQIKNETKTKQH